MVVLRDAGYTDLGPAKDSTEYSYVFSGLSGSLDHVLASPAALATVTGVDIWNINSTESVGLEYSRYDYNVTDLYRDDVYRASDHDPILVGFDTTAVETPAPGDGGTTAPVPSPAPSAGAGAGQTTVTPGPAPIAATDRDDRLAFTGAELTGGLVAALLMLAASTGLVVARRRRAARTD